MKTLRVRHHSAEINVSFKLSRFIFDWSVAQQMFIVGIADKFQDWRPIRPQDFRMTPAYSPGDVRCECQLFGGACSIVLTTDMLQLRFVNVYRDAYPTIMETIRRSSEWLSSDFVSHERDWTSFSVAKHLQAMDDDTIDRYLDQFMIGEVDSVVKLESEVKYLPSVRIMLADDEGGWVLRRSVEKSEWIDNGVFVDTQIQIWPPFFATLEDREKQLLLRLNRLADRAVGLCGDTE